MSASATAHSLRVCSLAQNVWQCVSFFSWLSLRRLKKSKRESLNARSKGPFTSGSPLILSFEVLSRCPLMESLSNFNSHWWFTRSTGEFPVTKNDDLKFNLKFKYQNLLLALRCLSAESWKSSETSEAFEVVLLGRLFRNVQELLFDKKSFY